MKNMYIRRIEEIRQEYGLKYAKMAKYCDMDPKYLTKMVNNDAQPKVETIEKICKGMDLTLQQFYTSAIFGTETEAQHELMRLYISLDPDNKKFLLKMAMELKELQDVKNEK